MKPAKNFLPEADVNEYSWLEPVSGCLSNNYCVSVGHLCVCFSVFLCPCVGGKKGPWPERENERKTEIENQTRTQCSSEYSWGVARHKANKLHRKEHLVFVQLIPVQLNFIPIWKKKKQPLISFVLLSRIQPEKKSAAKMRSQLNSQRGI